MTKDRIGEKLDGLNPLGKDYEKKYEKTSAKLDSMYDRIEELESLVSSTKMKLDELKRKTDSSVQVMTFMKNIRLVFEEMTDEWLDFIAACRIGTPHSYDIVEGPMADDTIWNFLQDYLSGEISREIFWGLAKFRYPTHQISFHTLEALDCISFERSMLVDE